MVHHINSQFQLFHLFFSGVPSFPHYHIAKPDLNHRKASTCVFNFSFFLVNFFTGFLHGGYMVVRQWFLSFFNCSSRFLLKLWSVKLYSKINMVLNTCFCFGGAQVFFILHSKVQFFFSCLLRWCYVILDNFPSCFMVHKLSGITYFKPIIFNSFMRSFATHQSLHWSYLGLYSTWSFP